MSVAYYIVLDNKEPGFDAFVNGKAVAHARDQICAITSELGLKGIDELASFGDLEDECDVPEEYRETETPWFEPEVGIAWVAGVRQAIQSNPSRMREPDRVLAELDEYHQLLQKAAAVKAKWHFAMDL